MIDNIKQKLSNRLNQALKKSRLSKKDIERKTGFSYTSVQKWFKEGSISNETLKTLANVLDEDYVWLLTGERSTEVREFHEQYKTERDILIPFYDVELSAGNGAVSPEFVETKKKLPFDLQWLRKNNLQADQCAVIKVKGDSMEPTLNHGDSVLIDRSKKAIIDREIYGIIHGEDVKIKRLVRKYDNSIEIISDNPNHSTEIIPPECVDHVEVIGRAVYRSGNL